MKKQVAVIGTFCVLLAAGTASAGQDSGPYVGGSIGSSFLNIAGQSVDFNDTDLGYKVFGGWNFGVIPLIDLGVEGSYVDFGTASSAQILNEDVGVTAWDLFGVGAVNLGPFGLFGKVGQAWWQSDSAVLQSILDESGNDMVYGIGVRIQLGSLAVRAEYERFDTGVIDVDYVSAGASWTF